MENTQNTEERPKGEIVEGELLESVVEASEDVLFREERQLRDFWFFQLLVYEWSQKKSNREEWNSKEEVEKIYHTVEDAIVRRRQSDGYLKPRVQ